MACFMGLVSFLAGRQEVLRVTSRHTQSMHNAAARATIQTAAAGTTPLTDAGLDGTGQVVQVRTHTPFRNTPTRTYIISTYV